MNYGRNIEIAKKLKVSPEAVRNVRSRLRKGERNFYSTANKRIARHILKEAMDK